jgi:hypothetical protein
MTAKVKVSGRAKISLILKRNIAWAKVSPGIRFLTTPMGTGICFWRKGAIFVLKKNALSSPFPGLLALRADQVAHRLHVGGIAGERQAPEFPATLDGSEH